MANGTFPLELPRLTDQRTTCAFISAVFAVVAFGVIFWGYPLEAMNFSDFHFYEREQPVLWGLSIVEPETGRINYAFLFHNEGLMTLLYFLLNRLPLDIPDKQVFVNSFSIALQVLNAVLFTAVLWRLVGLSRLFPYLLLFLLYPFAAANHYWQSCIPNNLAAAFFLGSLLLYLHIDYDPDKLGRNIVLRILPSLVLLWCSIITVELAVCLSPLYVYLALYYGNSRTAVLRFKRWITPYSVLACLFLFTSILPVFIFAGHRLTVASYGPRFSELAVQAHWATSLIAAATIVGNAVLVYASFLFANTVGIVVYPLADLVKHADFLRALSPGIYAGIGVASALGGVNLWIDSKQPIGRCAENELSPAPRFLLFLGFLWMALAYFPFSLSFGYSRNVGLTADRVNVLGSMGATLVLGSLLCMLRDRTRAALFFVMTGLLGVLLLNIQLQKAHYVEAEEKERALVDAVLEARPRLAEGGQEPIFMLDRSVKVATSRAKLRDALGEASLGEKLTGIGEFVFERYLTQPLVSTSFHLNGIMMFGCCPNTTSHAFNFYADSRGVPRPLVYKYEEPFRLMDEQSRYILGYLPAAVWQDPSDKGEFRSYDKRNHQLMVVEIGESTFHLGGALTYAFKQFDGAGSRAGVGQTLTLSKE